jgi:hypothetical protein
MIGDYKSGSDLQYNLVNYNFVAWHVYVKKSM